MQLRDGFILLFQLRINPIPNLLEEFLQRQDANHMLDNIGQRLSILLEADQNA